MEASPIPSFTPGIAEIVVLLGVLLGALLFTVIPFWMIFKKAGFHPALALLMIVPLANIVMLFVLAFARWPALGAKIA